MSKILIANWKLHPSTEKQAIKLAKESDFPNVVLCPPFLFLEMVTKSIKKAKLGAQDAFWEDEGAYTGEISTSELKSVGVEYVIVGHSERRAKFGETDDIVAKKAAAVLQGGLVPILCIGENKEQRDAGRAKEIVGAQLRAVLSKIPEGVSGDIYIAYEPVWAISSNQTGKLAEAEDAEDISEMLRYIGHIAQGGSLKFKLLYGGSTNPKNLKEIFSIPEVDGALIGSASLKPKEFTKMVEIRDKEF